MISDHDKKIADDQFYKLKTEATQCFLLNDSTFHPCNKIPGIIAFCLAIFMNLFTGIWQLVKLRNIKNDNLKAAAILSIVIACLLIINLIINCYRIFARIPYEKFKNICSRLDLLRQFIIFATFAICITICGLTLKEDGTWLSHDLYVTLFYGINLIFTFFASTQFTFCCNRHETDGRGRMTGFTAYIDLTTTEKKKVLEIMEYLSNCGKYNNYVNDLIKLEKDRLELRYYSSVEIQNKKTLIFIEWTNGKEKSCDVCNCNFAVKEIIINPSCELNHMYHAKCNTLDLANNLPECCICAEIV